MLSVTTGARDLLSVMPRILGLVPGLASDDDMGRTFVLGITRRELCIVVHIFVC